MTNENAESVAQITNPLARRVDVIGRGRMGQALTEALTNAGVPTHGPLGRGATGEGASIVLLCVPDREIATANKALKTDAVVGHVSASAPLALLEPHDRFGLHPLLSVTGAPARFVGATCAVQGSSPHAIGIAFALAERLGMRPRLIDAQHRALYHAAASAASNYITTVLGMAEQLAFAVGLDREALRPLVRATVEQWAQQGAHAALTGPIARGDEVTVVRQRDAIVAEIPEVLPLWDALVLGTRELATQRTKAAP